MNGFGGFLAAEPTRADYVRHVQHAASVIGQQRVALGPDFIEDVANTVDPILGGLLTDPKRLPLVGEMRRPADLAGLGPALTAALGTEAAAQVAHRRLVNFVPAALP